MGNGGECGTSLTGSLKAGMENMLIFKVLEVGRVGRVYGLEKNEFSGVLLQRVAERIRYGTEDPP